jgi:bifunctional DNA-binding transcriptional regulator/antitoxin component of YhaV-PrlF toxin-antitoxin module
MMETFTLKVDHQGRISIPAKLRKEAGLDGATEALAFLEDGGIVILTRERALLQAQRMAREALGARKGSVVDDFWAGKRREAAGEAKEMARYARRRKSA